MSTSHLICRRWLQRKENKQRESRDSSDSFLLAGRLRPRRPALSKEQAIILMRTSKREIPRSNWNQSQHFHCFVLQHDFPGVFFPRIIFLGSRDKLVRVPNRVERQAISPWGQWGSMADLPESLCHLCTWGVSSSNSSKAGAVWTDPRTGPALGRRFDWEPPEAPAQL